MRWIILFGFTLFATFLFSQESVILEANIALQDKNFKKALDLYLSAEKNHKGGAGMYQNMAIASAGVGQDAFAILYYEKALKYKPNDKNLQKDLTTLRKKNPLLDEPIIQMLPVRIFNNMTGIFTAGMWATISIILCFSGCFIILLYYPIRNFTRNVWISFITSCILFFVTFLFAWYRNEQIYHNRGMIITASDIVLKKSPDASSPDISDLPPGSKVYKKDQIADWSLVTTENGDTGWISVVAASKI
jgi:tetratricopeptide (TPR) repeat protein